MGCAYDCGPALPQMKQARSRFQNTVSALETHAPEFYGCQKFAWAQKITALNNGNELLNTRYHLSLGKIWTIICWNQEDALQKYLSASVLSPRLLLLDIAGNRIVNQTDLWSDRELFVLCCCITLRSWDPNGHSLLVTDTVTIWFIENASSSFQWLFHLAWNS